MIYGRSNKILVGVVILIGTVLLVFSNSCAVRKDQSNNSIILPNETKLGYHFCNFNELLRANEGVLPFNLKSITVLLKENRVYDVRILYDAAIDQNRLQKAALEKWGAPIHQDKQITSWTLNEDSIAIVLSMDWHGNDTNQVTIATWIRKDEYWDKFPDQKNTFDCDISTITKESTQKGETVFSLDYSNLESHNQDLSCFFNGDYYEEHDCLGFAVYFNNSMVDRVCEIYKVKGEVDIAPFIERIASTGSIILKEVLNPVGRVYYDNERKCHLGLAVANNEYYIYYAKDIKNVIEFIEDLWNASRVKGEGDK